MRQQTQIPTQKLGKGSNDYSGIFAEDDPTQQLKVILAAHDVAKELGHEESAKVLQDLGKILDELKKWTTVSEAKKASEEARDAYEKALHDSRKPEMESCRDAYLEACKIAYGGKKYDEIEAAARTDMGKTFKVMREEFDKSFEEDAIKNSMALQMMFCSRSDLEKLFDDFSERYYKGYESLSFGIRVCLGVAAEQFREIRKKFIPPEISFGLGDIPPGIPQVAGDQNNSGQPGEVGGLAPSASSQVAERLELSLEEKELVDKLEIPGEALIRDGERKLCVRQWYVKGVYRIFMEKSDRFKRIPFLYRAEKDPFPAGSQIPAKPKENDDPKVCNVYSVKGFVDILHDGAEKYEKIMRQYENEAGRMSHAPVSDVPAPESVVAPEILRARKISPDSSKNHFWLVAI